MIPITEENARVLSSVFRRDVTDGTTMVTQKGLRATLTVHTVRHVTTKDLRVEYVVGMHDRKVMEIHGITAMAVTSQGLLIQSPCMDVTIEVESPCGAGRRP